MRWHALRGAGTRDDALVVSWSMEFRLLVNAVAALTLIAGVSELRSMPVDVLPEYAPVTVEVQTEALGLSSAEVEQLITVPIEQDMLNGRRKRV